MKATIYHNPRCSKSRETLALLEKEDVALTIVNYLEAPLTKEELVAVLEKLDISACELIRKKEALYKELLDGAEATDEACLSMMAENPILMERPIVVVGEKAALGRPPESVLELL